MPRETDTTIVHDDNDETPDTSETPDTETAQRLQRLEENSVLQAVLADPEVQAVMAARKAGRRIKIVEDKVEQDAEPEVPSLTEGLEDDDPAKPVLSKLEVLTSRQQKAIESRFAEFSESLNGRLQAVEALAEEVRRKELKVQVDSAKSKFADLPKYKADMVALAKKHPELKVDELYLLAKNAAGALKLVESATFSEKPTSQPRKAGRTTNQPPPRRPGKAGFDDILNDALKDLTFEDIGS